MSPDDRIRVPGNGHDRSVLLDPARPADPALPPVTADRTPPDAPATPTPAGAATGRPDVTIALTPGQLAVGFGIIASLILLALGRRRRGR